MATSFRRGSAFIGPATAQRPRRRTANDLCEGCGHFRSEHTSGQACHRDDCPCEVMGWTPLPPVRSHTKTQITDEIKLQMESLLKSGMNYRKAGAIVGCSPSAVRKYFPGYGKNATADLEANRQVLKERTNRRIQGDMLRKEHKQ